ncbi:hypothetical protein D9M73_153260 [compost metagenome]
MVAVLGVVALVVEPVMPGLGAGSVLQQDQVGQLRWVGERGVRQAARGTHWHQLFTEQLQAFGAGPRALAEVERQVAATLQQVVGFLLAAQVQVDRRMPQAPAFQARHQPACTESGGRRNPQDFRFATVGTQVMGRHLDLREDFSHLNQVQIASRRHLQAAAHPAKQQVLQQLFELRDLFAHGALGQVQLFGGPGEAQMPGDGLEALQCSDRWQVAFIQHGRSLVLISYCQQCTA